MFLIRICKSMCYTCGFAIAHHGLHNSGPRPPAHALWVMTKWQLCQNDSCKFILSLCLSSNSSYFEPPPLPTLGASRLATSVCPTENSPARTLESCAIQRFWLFVKAATCLHVQCDLRCILKEGYGVTVIDVIRLYFVFILPTYSYDSHHIVAYLYIYIYIFIYIYIHKKK